MLSFLHNDVFLKVAGGLVGLAIGLKAIVPGHTIAAHVADVVIELGAALGVYSSTGRAAK